jgi:hypothetical protein
MRLLIETKKGKGKQNKKLQVLPNEASIVPPPLPLVHPFNNPNILMNLTIKTKET